MVLVVKAFIVLRVGWVLDSRAHLVSVAVVLKIREIGRELLEIRAGLDCLILRFEELILSAWDVDVFVS